MYTQYVEAEGRPKLYIYVQEGGGPKASVELLKYLTPHGNINPFFQIFLSILPEVIRKTFKIFQLQKIYNLQSYEKNKLLHKYFSKISPRF